MKVPGRKRGAYRNRLTLEMALHAVSDQPADGCWNWPWGLDVYGYGRVRVGGERVKSHRASYEWLVGPIAAGLEIDHLCRNKACFNPRHLEPVTTEVNTLRNNGVSAKNARKNACVRGHTFDAANTYRAKNGQRVCRECMRQHKRNWRGRHSADHGSGPFAAGTID